MSKKVFRFMVAIPLSLYQSTLLYQFTDVKTQVINSPEYIENQDDINDLIIKGLVDDKFSSRVVGTPRELIITSLGILVIKELFADAQRYTKTSITGI